MTYTDAHIEHWGEIYRASPVLQGYCTFAAFISRPQWYVDQVGRLPLREQLAVQRRLDAARRQA